MSVPKNDEDSKRWFRFFNPTNETIPARGTFFGSGKRFRGPYSEKELPKEKSNDGATPSWDELQKQVGYGNAMIVAHKPFFGYGFYYFTDGGWWHNSGTPVGPQSWGKCTQDYPCLARLKVVGPANIRDNQKQLGFVPLGFTPVRNSFDLVASFNKYGGVDGAYGWGWGNWGWGGWGGWGWGGWGAWGAKASFWVLDIVEGFDKSEGLAWVMPGGQQGNNSDYELEWSVADVKEGDNPAQPRVFLPSTVYIPRKGPIYSEEGGDWLHIAAPGTYQIQMGVGSGGTGIGPNARENPWSQLSITWEIEGNGQQIEFFSPRIRNSYVTLAPPVAVPGCSCDPHYSASTYISQYVESQMFLSFAVSEPRDFDPTNEDNPDLVKIRVHVHRTTNSPNTMSCSVFANGTLKLTGRSTGNDSQSPSLTGVAP